MRRRLVNLARQVEDQILVVERTKVARQGEDQTPVVAETAAAAGGAVVASRPGRRST